MKYRFQVVCSSFHKGRLRIVYEPAFFQSAEFNTNYQYIVDISRERDFTVDIGWGQNIGYAAHRQPGVVAPPWSTTSYPGDPWPSANGLLSVYVLSELTVPNSIANNDVEINVFISTGDDFEVAFPDSDSIRQLSWFDPEVSAQAVSQPAPNIIEKLDPQAGVDETYEENNSPMIDEAIHQMAPSVNEDYTPVVYHGDPITSFRTCLKRYNLHSAFSVASSDAVTLAIQTPDFPMYKGRAPYTIHEDASGDGYNYMHMTLLNYLTPAFNCRRGGTCWKYHFSGFEPDNNNLALVARTRNIAPTASRGFQQYEIPIPNQAATTRFGRIRNQLAIFPTLWDGAHMTDLTLNPVIEVEIPFYQNARYYQAKFASFGAPNESYSNVGLHTIYANLKRKENSSIIISNFVSTAEDFNLTFYLGPPVAYYDPVMPTPLQP